MGFKIASSGDSQNSQLWCTSNFGTRLGGSLAPKRVSKPMVFKMERKTRNFGAPAILVSVSVFPNILAGGGKARNLMDKRFCGHLGVSEVTGLRRSQTALVTGKTTMAAARKQLQRFDADAQALAKELFRLEARYNSFADGPFRAFLSAPQSLRCGYPALPKGPSHTKILLFTITVVL